MTDIKYVLHLSILKTPILHWIFVVVTIIEKLLAHSCSKVYEEMNH